ncbi:papain-like cysteine protease family protein [Amycolatopsis sp. BJA-103]|uniref:papain-like cysteine protease family protein n=1 Tax=Amycolatopsis sp. BJA-103 TaxID=1911175 RepID=UPI001304FAE5|nr:papain-like cysteine protease family protein [Amycolatopsis sp. BJA-103]
MKAIRRAVTGTFLMVPAFAAVVVLAPVAQATDTGRPGGVESSKVADNTHLKIASGAAKDAVAAKRVLRYTQLEQKYDMWCWAADGAGIEQALGASISQDEFCAETKGTAVGYCPNETAYMTEIAQGFRNTGFQATYVDSALSWNEVRRQIDAGQPIMADINWSNGGYHAQTIYGYDAGNSTINYGDPWPSYQRYQTRTYNSYLSNSSFSWADTISGIRKG